MDYSTSYNTQMHYSASVAQQDNNNELNQFWEQQHQHHPAAAAAAGYSAHHDASPIFTNPFDIKHAHPLASPYAAHDPLYDAQPPVFDPSTQFYASAPAPHSYAGYNTAAASSAVDSALYGGYGASSPALSDLSSLSSGGLSGGSPLSPPHLLTPVSPHDHHQPLYTHAHQHHQHHPQFLAPSPPSPVMHSLPTMLPPMPLDASSMANAAYMPHQLHGNGEPASPTGSSSSAGSYGFGAESTHTTIAPSTTSTGPADGQYAVLTLTGHTIAASGSYKDVLSAARSVRKANESGLVDDSRTCPFCGKVCDRPSTLKTHLNSHTGARPHTCTVPGCTRQFTVLSNMYRHAKVCAAQRAREVRRAQAQAASAAARR